MSTAAASIVEVEAVQSPVPAVRPRLADSARLPVLLTTLVGREADTAAAAALLRGDVRLLALTGPGGVGKTRLAIAVATELQTEFADGVAFVSLAQVSDPDLVAATIASALGLRDRDARGDLARVIDVLRYRELLLVLDTFEQVSNAAPLLVEMLGSAPGLKILVTSRATLQVRGAREFLVPPLALPLTSDPIDAESLARYPATALFVARASDVRSDLTITPASAAAIVEICARLDGLPLAIELAAARSTVLSPPALLSRLERRLALLTGGSRDLPTRQQTLRNTIVWSYDLLTPEQQAIFRGLAVFSGGCTLEAAEAVLGEDGDREISRRQARGTAPRADRNYGPGGEASPSVLDELTVLVGHSLVRRADLANGEPRLILLDTIREFALEALEADSPDVGDALRRAHAEWFTALAEEVGPNLHGADQYQWWNRLQTEHGNLRVALTWLADRADWANCLRLAGALWEYWWFGGHLREGRSWLLRSLEHATDAPPALRARALEGAAYLVHGLSDHERAIPLLEESRRLYETVGDLRGAGAAQYMLGVVAEDQGEYDRAHLLLTDAAATAAKSGDRRGKAFSLLHLGMVAYGQADFPGATAYCEQGMALARELGSKAGVFLGTYCLALVAVDSGDLPLAAARYREIVAWQEESGVFGTAWQRRSIDAAGRNLSGVATLAAVVGLFETAARLFAAAAADYEALGATPALPERTGFEQALAAVKEQLSPDAFAVAWETGSVMSPREALACINAVLSAAEESPTPSPRADADAVGLTERELEVLRLLVEGLPDREIAERLYISPRTAMRHVANILGKFDAHSRTAAVSIALRRGLI